MNGKEKAVVVVFVVLAAVIGFGAGSIYRAVPSSPTQAFGYLTWIKDLATTGTLDQNFTAVQDGNTPVYTLHFSNGVVFEMDTPPSLSLPSCFKSSALLNVHTGVVSFSLKGC